MIVYSPQIYENYSLQSGEGLSVLFVVIWLIGDLTNLFGALMAGLLPTIIILAVYYTLCDIILFYQIFYYRWRRHQRHRLGIHHRHDVPPTESSRLLGDEETVVAPNKWQRLFLNRALLYCLGFAFIFAMGFGSVIVMRRHPAPPSPPVEIIEWKSQVLGYISAACYLGSRIPQIIKNAKTKCAGLSLALFVFCLCGNITYVLSIVVADPSRRHIVANAPWLAGSGLTLFLDFFVLYQFYHYRSEADQLDSDSESESLL